MSKLAVDEAFDITEFTTKDEVEEINDPRVKSNQDCSEDREDHDQVKHRLRGLFGVLNYFVYEILLTLLKRNMARSGDLGNSFHGNKCFPV